MISYSALSPALWTDLETLFGANGACGGCWCMAWRMEHWGKAWNELKGEKARLSLKNLVESGSAKGILAYDDGVPVGWCAFGPRMDFLHLESVKAYRREDAAEVWSVICFYIPRRMRGKGLSRGLLQAAVAEMRRLEVRTVEAYPSPPPANGKQLPAAFVWTGPLKIYHELGFVETQRLSDAKPLVRLNLKPNTP